MRDPAALSLARLASLAARVEPELLRALRLSLVPTATAGTEAEVWFSEIIHARGARAVTLDPDAALHLRSSVLAEGRDRVARAIRIVRRLHRDAPALLRLEERLIVWSLLRRTARIDATLASIVATIVHEPARAEDLAAWAQRALPRLPPAARDAESYWSLVFAANQLLPSTSILPPAHAAAVGAPLPAIFASAADAFIAVERRGDTVRLRRAESAAPDTITAPAIHPLVVVITSDGLPPHARIVDRARWTDDVPVRGRTIRFRVADGREHVATTVAATAPLDPSRVHDTIVAFSNLLVDLADRLPEPRRVVEQSARPSVVQGAPPVEQSSPPAEPTHDPDRATVILAIDTAPSIPHIAGADLRRLRALTGDPDLSGEVVMPIAQGVLPDATWVTLHTTRAGVEALRTAYRKRDLEQLDGATIFWLAERDPPPELDDPNRGRFGGVPDTERLSVRARITPLDRHDYRVDLVIATDHPPRRRPSDTLHMLVVTDGDGRQQTFDPLSRDRVVVELRTWRASTIGVVMGELGRAELDLRNGQGLPESFVDPPHALSELPLEPGTQWRYRVAVFNPSVMQGDEGETSMHVVDALVLETARPTIAALVAGDWTGAEGRRWILVRHGSLYFRLDGDEERFARLRAGDERLALAYEQLVFRFPIATGAPLVPVPEPETSDRVCERAERREDGSGTYTFAGSGRSFTVASGVGVTSYTGYDDQQTETRATLIEVIRPTR